MTTSRKTQDQRALLDQLRDLIQLANEAGMYDAADWVKANLDRIYARTTYSTEANHVR